MIDPHKEYTLLEAAKAVLAHVEDETAWRHGSQCTLCFSYRKALRDAIERHEKHFRALVDSRDFWMKAAKDENEKVIELNDMLVAKKKSNDDYHKALEARVAELEALLPKPVTPPIAPPKWKVGMKVRYRDDAEFGWAKGQYGVINELRKEYRGKAGNEYQVFYTHPMHGDKVYKGASYWTTPADVDWVQE